MWGRRMKGNEGAMKDFLGNTGDIKLLGPKRVDFDKERCLGKAG